MSGRRWHAQELSPVASFFLSIRSRFPVVIALFALGIAAPAWARGVPQSSAHEPLGSLIANGAVEVNGTLVSTQPAEFVGGAITTRENGSATLTIDGRGEFDFAPLTQVVFTDNPRYLAQVIYGTITFKTSAEHSNVTVRAGDYIVTAAPGAPPQTAATIQRENDGSGLVSSTTGNVQILAMEGDTSLVLQPGESTSLAGDRQAVNAQASAAVPVVPDEPPHNTPKRHWMRTVLIIVGGAAVGGAVAATHHGGTAAATSGTTASPSPTQPANPLPLPLPLTR